jgi:hypothetical protein
MADATDGQIQEIEKLIEKARAIADPESKEACDLYQQAIALADKYFKIERPKQAVSEPVYDPKETQAGATVGTIGSTDQGDEPKAKITLGPDAFVWNGKASASWLASAKVHEYEHARNLQIVPLSAADKEQAKKVGWKEADIEKIRFASSKYRTDEDELSAYVAQYNSWKKTGISDEMGEWIWGKAREHLKALPEELQKKWRGKEAWLQFVFY